VRAGTARDFAFAFACFIYNSVNNCRTHCKMTGFILQEVDHNYIRILCCGCGKVFDCPLYCGNRFCDVCNSTRRKRVRRRMEYLIDHVPPSDGKNFLHLTLTIANQPDLSRMAKQLLLSFRRLRQRAFWKNHVDGGAFVIEITRSSYGWHAHIHAIIMSDFIPWKKLKREWTDVSGSSGVYIKKIPKIDIVRYLTKYITKTGLSLPDQYAASGALKGSRLFQPFGSWYAISCQAPKYVPQCTVCGGSSFDMLERVVTQLRRSTPVTKPRKYADSRSP